MKRVGITILMLVVMGGMACADRILSGYEYGNAKKPVGDEWNSPQKIAYNKAQPHNWFFNFENKAQALKVLPENSAYWMSLDGSWKFKWVNVPEKRPVGFQEPNYNVSNWDDVQVPMNWNVYGIGKDGSLRYGKPIYTNTWVIYQFKREVDDWKKGVMQTPPTDWTTFKDRNEVGSYWRDFTIPANWQGREVFICFDGVDSFFYLWINGQYVGFSKNSRNAARFNITPYLNKKGKNVVAAEVYRNSDGSYLEAQDMFRLPGIFRTVSLESVPEVEIRDLQTVCDMDDEMDNAILKCTAKVCNHGNKPLKDYKVVFNIYKNKLFSDEIATEEVNHSVEPLAFPLIGAKSEVSNNLNLHMFNQSLWSAEEPNRYTLVATLLDAKGKTVETVSTFVGFRKVGLRTLSASMDEFNLAGRYFYFNGQAIKLKGVNRHEHSLTKGHAIDRQQMEAEIMMMKRANINTVRTCHYPDDPYWYYLCEKYGMYVVSEANNESHEYGFDSASISHPAEWRNAHVDRVMEMAHSYLNNSAIVMWSLGNEAGPGKNFKAAYDSLKAFDSSRPVHYERNLDISEVGSSMYPSINWVRKAATGKENVKYPFFLCEYAHSMGNACGGLNEYWRAMESSNFMMGGCIWDWVDQALQYYDPRTHAPFMAYGGDFGDKPNDGQFCMNGIMFANFKPKPQYYEVKRVYQNIQIDSINGPQGFFTVFNKNYFTDLSDYDIQWSLWKDGKRDSEGLVDLKILPPRQRLTIHVPFKPKELDAQSEYFVKIQCVLRSDKPWAKKGYVQAEQQFLVHPAVAPTPKNTASLPNASKLKVQQTADSIVTISSPAFAVSFNSHSGTIHSLEYGSMQVIEPGCGPKIEAMRAFTNNDNWFYKSIFQNGLHNLRQTAAGKQVKQNADGSVSLVFDVTAQAPNECELLGGSSEANHALKTLDKKPDFKITAQLQWNVAPNGEITLNTVLVPEGNATLARLGFVLETPQTFNSFTYYGRGPIGNYPDRKCSQNIEVYTSQIDTLANIWPKPQDCGNHEEVRWCSVAQADGRGILFESPTHMSAQALPYSDLALTLAGHPYQLPPRANNYIHLDAAVIGLGGNSCGQGGPLEEQRVSLLPHPFTLVIKPCSK